MRSQRDSKNPSRAKSPFFKILLDAHAEHVFAGFATSSGRGVDVRLPRSQATFQTAYVKFQVSLAPAVPADHSGVKLARWSSAVFQAGSRGGRRPTEIRTPDADVRAHECAARRLPRQRPIAPTGSNAWRLTAARRYTRATTTLNPNDLRLVSGQFAPAVLGGSFRGKLGRVGRRAHD